MAQLECSRRNIWLKNNASKAARPSFIPYRTPRPAKTLWIGQCHLGAKGTASVRAAIVTAVQNYFGPVLPHPRVPPLSLRIRFDRFVTAPDYFPTPGCGPATVARGEPTPRP